MKSIAELCDDHTRLIAALNVKDDQPNPADDQFFCVIDDKIAAVICELTDMPSATMADIAAKALVVHRYMEAFADDYEGENPEFHLMRSVIDDLLKLTGRIA